DHRSELIPAGLGRDDLAQGIDVSDQNVRRLNHLHGKSGINHITAGEAEMEPTVGWIADVFGHVGGESNDVVIQLPLQFLASFQTESGACFYPGQILFRNYPLSAQGFAGEKFNLQPNFELSLLAPDLPHL